MGTRIDPKDTSAMTLRRIEQNDPSLDQLHIYLWRDDLAPEKLGAEGVGHYFLSSPVPPTVDLQRLCDAIGENTHVETIYFNDNSVNDNNAVEGLVDGKRKLFDGLQRNGSVRHLAIVDCDIGDRGIGLDILRGCALSGSLTNIALDYCALGRRGFSTFRQAIGCSDLEKIWLEGCNIDDHALEGLVSGSNLLQVQRLDLADNRVGLAGCQALASLLQDSRCKLQSIKLDDNNIDDDCVGVLCKSLRYNRKLESLFLCNNDSITRRSWGAFCNAMFDRSCINRVYHANHSLNFLSVDAPSELAFLLNLNRDPDKKRVTITKIILAQRHVNIDMEPFLQWDLRMMPVAVRWFDSARSTMDTDSKGAAVDPKGLSETIDALKLSAIYQFARALPLMFVLSKTGSKRTRDEAS